MPDEVFGEPYVPPVVGRLGQRPQPPAPRRRSCCARPAASATATSLKLPGGKPFEIEFLDFQPALQPHTQPYQANLKRLGIEARSRIVDAAQYRRRLEEFDFDMATHGARRRR